MYRDGPLAAGFLEASFLRWFKISEALVARGHRVDIAVNAPGDFRRRFPVRAGRDLWEVPLGKVRWEDYDAVKTLFHVGFETLEKYGGASHPFIISKLGSVVDKEDRPGVYFYGEHRRRLYRIQERVSERARYVALLTRASRRLWVSRFGGARRTLLVPGAADRALPPPGGDPYPPGGRRRCLFAGGIYSTAYQPEAHAELAGKLNLLGRTLARRGIRLFAVGTGDASGLDPRGVTHAGPVPYERSWDYLRHADVGIVLALGRNPNHNESTKIYHYLRAGLPVVCESGFPNEGLITRVRLGFIVPNGDMEAMAARIEEAARARWDKRRAVRAILKGHTWDERAARYERALRGAFRSAPRAGASADAPLARPSGTRGR